ALRTASGVRSSTSIGSREPSRSRIAAVYSRACSAERDAAFVKTDIFGIISTRPQPFRRGARQILSMDSIMRDVKYALRSVAASKKFAAIVIATLALGIGANTAVFGVLNAVVLRPLPYDHPERLVRVYHSAGGDDNSYLTGLAA